MYYSAHKCANANEDIATFEKGPKVHSISQTYLTMEPSSSKHPADQHPMEPTQGNTGLMKQALKGKQMHCFAQELSCPWGSTKISWSLGFIYTMTANSDPEEVYIIINYYY